MFKMQFVSLESSKYYYIYEITSDEGFCIKKNTLKFSQNKWNFDRNLYAINFTRKCLAYGKHTFSLFFFVIFNGKRISYLNIAFEGNFLLSCSGN